MKKIDSNGFWRIDNNPISKVGIYPYLGKQISPELIPDKIYMVYRPAEELFSDEAIESFNENPVPLINDHTMIGAQFTAPEKKGIDGVINNFRRNGDVLVGDISIFSEDMKSCIEGGKKELSMGYFCNYDLTPGTYNGQHYDAIQRDIRSNHVALVDHGRMGSDVRVYDAFCFDAMDAEFEESEHPRSKDGKFTNKGGAGNNKVTPLFVRSKGGYTANPTIKSNSTKQETNSETKEKYYKEISAERIKKYNGSPRLLLSPQEIDFIKQQANVNQLRSFEDYVGAFWKEYNTNKSTYEAGKHQDDLKKHFDYTKGKLDNLINEIRANKNNIHSADLSTGATDITAKYPKASETVYETKSNSPFQFMEQKDVEQYSKAQQENSKKQRQYFDELREKTAKLDQSLVNSVYEYTDMAYWEINKTLRGEKTQSNMGWTEEEIQKNIRNIKQAMQPLEHDMLLHRGSDMNSIRTIFGEELAGDFSNAKEIKKALEGKTLVSDAFISTSDLINNFNNANAAGYNTARIQWTLKAPKGTKAIDVRSFTKYSLEDEILLDSGSKLKIEKVNFGYGDNGRQIFITASILQSHGTEDAAINFDAIAQDSEESTKTEKTKNHFDDFILRIDETQAENNGKEMEINTTDAQFEESKHPRYENKIENTAKDGGNAAAVNANNSEKEMDNMSDQEKIDEEITKDSDIASEIAEVARKGGCSEEAISTIVDLMKTLTETPAKDDDEAVEEEKADDEDLSLPDEEDKPVKDAECDKDKEKDINQSLDALPQKIFKMFAERDRLAKKLKPLIGDFDYSDMTMKDLSKYACDKLDLDVTGLDVQSVLSGYLAGHKENQKVYSLDNAVNNKADDEIAKYLKGE